MPTATSPSSSNSIPPADRIDSPPRPSVSAKKLAANRRNAQKSTGPRTAEGKARASKNATTHGFFARSALIIGEDPAEYRAFRVALMRRLDPGDELELQVAEGVIASFWKQRRLSAAEARAHNISIYRQCRSEGMSPEQMRTLYTERPWVGAKALSDDLSCGSENVASHFLAYDMRLQRSAIRGMRELREMKADRRSDGPGEFTAELIAREMEEQEEEENERNEATEASADVSDEGPEGYATDGAQMDTDKGGEEVKEATKEAPEKKQEPVSGS